MLCKNCNINESVKYSKYTTGEFCSRNCARGFSSKEKRLEINKTVSKSLKGRGNGNIKIICKNCLFEFETTWNRRDNLFCSHSCSAIYRSLQPEYIEKLSIKRIESIIGGNVNNYGTKMTYVFNDINIKCDSKIEYSCLDFFVKSGATEIERCNFYITYLDGEKIRRYNPDFKIKIDSIIYIVEAKSYMTIKTVNEKWRMYNELSVLKKKALEQYCEQNNYKSFWFTKDINLKNYNSLKMAL
jgi:hypothetical protein